MAIWDKVIAELSKRIAASVWEQAQIEPVISARAYRMGYYKPQLKVRGGQFDDNLGLNYIGLIEARIVSQMFGQGVELDFEGDTETAQEQYIAAVLDANKQEVLFHRAAVAAGEAGTGYLYLIDAGQVGEDGNTYPRLLLVDPVQVTMETLPEDYEVVVRYIIQYKFADADGKEKVRRRTIQREMEGEAERWTIRDQINSGGRWEDAGETPWPHPFAPMLHWQNLPSAFDARGEPDITPSLIDTQDRLNFLASNISKLIRYYAHPMRVYKGTGDIKKMDVGADQMVKIGPEEDVTQLEPLGDLAASLAFFDKLEKSMFNDARVVDLSSYEDKIGSLTNFGLRVLYQDDLAMIGTKRELFGDMLEELVRRLLLMAGMEEIPCAVVWPDFLPTNQAEEIAAYQADLNMGIVSKETVSKQRGYDWDAEQERIEADRQQEDNIGGALLRAFTQGGGGGNPRER